MTFLAATAAVLTIASILALVTLPASERWSRETWGLGRNEQGWMGADTAGWVLGTLSVVCFIGVVIGLAVKGVSQ